MKRILLCEDEVAIRSFVVVNLRRAGYDVIEAATGEEALARYEACDGAVDVALLDVMLPQMDGFAVCENLRRRNPHIGIIMLTARSQEADKMLGFKQGADDYITKPFSPSELVARVEALIRRVQAVKPMDECIQVGAFALNLSEHSITFDGKPLELAHNEFMILQHFLTHPNQVVSRTELLHRVWGEDFCGEDKVVDVNIRRLRMKIEKNASEPQYLQTVWGHGYCFVV